MKKDRTGCRMARHVLVSLAVTSLIFAPVLFVIMRELATLRSVRRQSAATRHVGYVQLISGLLTERSQNVQSEVDRVASGEGLASALLHRAPLIPEPLIWTGARRDDLAGLRITKRDGASDRLVYVWHSDVPTRGVVVRISAPVRMGSSVVGTVEGLVDVGLRDDWIDRVQPPLAATLVVIDEAGRTVYQRSAADAVAWSDRQEAAWRRAGGDHGSRELAAAGDEPALAMAWCNSSPSRLRVVMTQPMSVLMQPVTNLTRTLGLIGALLYLAFVFAGARICMGLQCRRDLVTALSDREKQLASALEARTRFIEDAAHDLQGPLHTALLAVTTIGTPTCPVGSPEATECLEMAADELRAASSGLRRLVTASRLESGVYQPVMQSCDMRALIEEAVKRQNGPLVRRSLQCRLPHAPVMVNADADAVMCVLRNLLQNAVRYTPEGASIKVSSEWGADGYQRVSVADSGPGVAPEHMAHVFERFWRAPGSPSQSGFGLGLAICKAYIEAHGGRIGVGRSEMGGAEFWFTLPPAPSEQGL